MSYRDGKLLELQAEIEELKLLLKRKDKLISKLQGKINAYKISKRKRRRFQFWC